MVQKQILFFQTIVKSIGKDKARGPDYDFFSNTLKFTPVNTLKNTCSVIDLLVTYAISRNLRQRRRYAFRSATIGYYFNTQFLVLKVVITINSSLDYYHQKLLLKATHVASAAHKLLYIITPHQKIKHI